MINLANIDIMAHITRIALVESKAAIWDYDPELPSNRISNGGLDVIATIRTLAIKVSLNTLSLTTATDCSWSLRQIQASGTRIEKFYELQIQSGIKTPLKIPLHSNVRWGTAFLMLDRAIELRTVSLYLVLLIIITISDMFCRPLRSLSTALTSFSVRSQRYVKMDV